MISGNLISFTIDSATVSALAYPSTLTKTFDHICFSYSKIHFFLKFSGNEIIFSRKIVLCSGAVETQVVTTLSFKELKIHMMRNQVFTGFLS